MARARTRLSERRRKRALLSLGMVCAGILIAMLGIIYGAHRPELTIAAIQVAGETTVPEDVLVSAAAGALQGNRWLLIPKRFSPLAPLHAVEQAMISSFPQLLSANASRTSLTTVVVAVRERMPVAVWCSSEGCYLVDTDGLIFGRAPLNHAYRVYTGPTDEGNPARFASGTFAELHLFLDEISGAMGRTITSVTVDPNQDVSATLGTGGTIIFSAADIGEDLIDKVRILFLSPEFVARGAFEYADFRFPGKAIVK